MDKIAMLIFLFSVAVTMALVMGNKDDDPLRNLFGGPNVWAPLMKWNRAPPNDGGPEYGEYGDQQDVDAEAGQPIVVKRSHSRQPVCEVLLNIVYVGNGTDGYEYRPNHYVTESCFSSYNTYQNKCTETGLSCTQIRQKIYITRRKVTGPDTKAVNCWEHVALKEIDAGCECMWPKEQIGDKHSYRLGK
ncbi:AGAP012443-PA [Anopheles gambiae str. PEST]|uniref:AGAP012443-PA n=1 Tax=Anopheles gambiae TaxID=7165 RepID=A0NDH4_ANOGA|nr:AGAP012443-PA [Anopheles gambiae str. PEST]